MIANTIDATATTAEMKMLTLWSAPNILISPHCSAAQDRYTETLLALFADNLDRFTRGEPMRNVVDRAAGY